MELLSSFLCLSLALAGTLQSPIDLLFIANEGVLVGTQSGKVLIDALYDEPNPAYAAPPAELLESMSMGGAPFGGVNLVLLTHNHPDHYSPLQVARFLQHHRETVFVAPVDAVEALKEVAPDWSRIRERVVAVTLEVGAVFDTVIGDVRLEAFRTLHSGDREEPHNLMYLVEMDGRTIFHEGDSNGKVETFATLNLGGRRIDLALVHFWFPLDEDGEAILRGVLEPNHIGLIHLPLRLREDAPTTIGQVAGNYGDMFLLIDSGDRRTIPD